MTLAPELQVDVIDRNHLLREIALIEELESSENSSFAAFNGSKYIKVVKITGCGNEKSLAFLTSYIRDIGELCPNAKIDVVALWSRLLIVK